MHINKFRLSELAKVERYDKLIEKVSKDVKNKLDQPKLSNCFEKHKNKVINYEKWIDLRSYHKRKSFGRSHSKAEKLKFFNGSGNITSWNAPKDESYHSMYNDSFQGKASPDRGNNVAHYFTVSSAGACIPEHKMITFYSTRLGSFSKGFQKFQRRIDDFISNKKTLNHNIDRNIMIRRNLSMDYTNS